MSIKGFNKDDIFKNLEKLKSKNIEKITGIKGLKNVKIYHKKKELKDKFNSLIGKK